MLPAAAPDVTDVGAGAATDVMSVADPAANLAYESAISLLLCSGVKDSNRFLSC